MRLCLFVYACKLRRRMTVYQNRIEQIFQMLLGCGVPHFCRGGGNAAPGSDEIAIESADVHRLLDVVWACCARTDFVFNGDRQDPVFGRVDRTYLQSRHRVDFAEVPALFVTKVVFALEGN
jgi:hypothetical protein